MEEDEEDTLGGGGGGGPPAFRTLLSHFPYLYLPRPALFRAAPVPCKLAESKHLLTWFFLQFDNLVQLYTWHMCTISWPMT